MTEKIPAAEFRKREGRVKGAKAMTVDGIRFHSRKEARRWQVLRLREQAGEISQLERQVKIPLDGRDGPIMTDAGKQQRVYVADFRYLDWCLNGAVVIEDAKGWRTDTYRIKRAILAAMGIEVVET